MKPQWQQIINEQQGKAYFQQLAQTVAEKRAQGLSIFPTPENVFRAFDYVDLAEVKVVILGQDPYHGVGADNQPQAHGLAFSVPHGVKVPPSLKNIYKELATDIAGFEIPEHGHLTAWAKQGVLMLNTVLTVEQGKAHSHAKLGWETFTDEIIKALNDNNDGCVFLLWGSHAHKKGKNIDQEKHCVLKAVHPSPLSVYRGFFGCQHFSKANLWLTEHNKPVIDWTVFE